MVQMDSAIDNGMQNLRKMELIHQQLGYQHDSLLESAKELKELNEFLNRQRND